MSVKNETLKVFINSNILISAVLSQKSVSSQLHKILPANSSY
ncbi:hypothetical protein [Bacillus piscicola]|nr:hypothetical protein [Bacillus piscicola]